MQRVKLSWSGRSCPSGRKCDQIDVCILDKDETVQKDRNLDGPEPQLVTEAIVAFRRNNVLG